jgi:hypothetical protein
MFDYRELILPVRRLVNDLSGNHIDIKESTDKDSYYVMLSEDGYATPLPSGVLINGIPIASGGYAVYKNVLKFNAIVPGGSEVFVQYDSVSYSDDVILGYIDDSIHNLVETVFNTTFNFGVAPEGQEASKYITYDIIDNDLKSLFIHGAAMQIMGAKMAQAGGDAIYIKDGDTTIDTAKSSSESARAYDPIQKRWSELLEIVRINRFSGVVMY